MPTPVPTSGGANGVLIAAGDIANCSTTGDAKTAALIASLSGMVAPLGDNAYPDGSAADYTDCYAPTWGAYLSRTQPAAGNHDYLTPGAAGYFGYFGASAGNPTKGYYSYSLGSWHIVVLNSNCSEVGGCAHGDPQETWLRADLAAHPNLCTLAYWHHPYFSSGQNGDSVWMKSLVTDLYNAGVEIMLSGHDHDYERFAPQNPSGGLNNSRGIVQFVVGTGGSNHTPLTYPLQPNSLVANDTTFGVLKLILKSTSYSFQFIPIAGYTFTDSGSANCQ